MILSTNTPHIQKDRHYDCFESSFNIVSVKSTLMFISFDIISTEKHFLRFSGVITRFINSGRWLMRKRYMGVVLRNYTSIPMKTHTLKYKVGLFLMSRRNACLCSIDQFKQITIQLSVGGSGFLFMHLTLSLDTMKSFYNLIRIICSYYFRSYHDRMSE